MTSWLLFNSKMTTETVSHSFNENKMRDMLVIIMQISINGIEIRGIKTRPR